MTILIELYEQLGKQYRLLGYFGIPCANLISTGVINYERESLTSLYDGYEGRITVSVGVPENWVTFVT
jgi:hypothetical protein